LGERDVAFWRRSSERGRLAGLLLGSRREEDARGGLRRWLWRRLPWKIRLALIVPYYALLVGGASLGGLFLYYTIAFPDPLSLRQKERAPVIRILARDGSVLAERGTPHDYMPLDLLPQHVTDAVIAIEDRRFDDHRGIDLWGLARAALANLRAGRTVQGGSTISQQLAKNLFLSPERTLTRKVEEVALALWLELRLTKQDILELYLNRVYFGGGAYGIEAAAQRYFDRSARELTVAEAALLAGLLKAPSKFSPASSPGLARQRARVVLAAMRDADRLTPEAHAAAVQQPIRFADLKPNKDASGIEYAVDFVLERLPPLVGSGHAEVVVETTIDADLQRRAQAAIQAELARHGEESQAGQAGVVVLDTEGAIRVLVGGRSYLESQFNRAVKARRQPGSAFKAFVYLAALESGLQPASTVYDLPITVGDWSPRNENGQFKGPMTLRQGLAQSVNTIAVRLQQEVGTRRVIGAAQRLGISSELHDSPSLALGTSEVTLLELTGAYAAFANGGSRVEPHAIRRVRMSSGRVLFARQAPRQHQVAAPVHVGAMNDMLNAALVAGTGRRAAIPHHPAAGKTGTTQDFRDAWFVGYTAHLATGVWVGNDNGRAMNRVAGGSLPALIWREVMTAAHQGRAPLALPGTARPFAEFAAPALPAAPLAIPASEREAAAAPPAPSAVPPPARAPAPPAVAQPRLPRTPIATEFFETAPPAPPPPAPPQGATLLPRFNRAPPGMMSLGGAR
jgi:penicillin-binding protein 1A